MATSASFTFEPDRPIEIEPFPWTGLASYADVMTSLLPLPSGTPILLSGDWGAGKTSLLMAVERRLRRTTPSGPAVWFEAWRYEAEVGLLPALVRAVWEATPEDTRNAEGRQKLWGSLWRCAVAVGFRALPLLGGIPGFDTLGTITKGLTASGVDRDLQAVELRSSQIPATDATRELWRSFRDLLQLAWPDQTLTILVDDLDRCTPDGAMSLLNGIRLLVAGAESEPVACQFIVALDRKVLAEAVSKKFAGISSFDGNRYLEKLFPLTFQVPSPSTGDVECLLRKSLGLLSEAGQEKETDREDLEALLTALKEPVFANPRLIKRCVNRYRLVMFLERRLELGVAAFNGLQAKKDLADWLAAIERWPQLRVLLTRHDEKFWMELVARIDGQDGAELPNEATHLVRQEGAIGWLRKNHGRSKTFRGVERRLGKVGL